MDSKRFDALARHIGEQTNRRSMMKTAAGGTLALLGLGALGQAALGQNVSAESNGFDGDDCVENADCKRGLICNSGGRCEYKKNCGGKKNDARKNNNDCCNGKNLKCQNRKCKRNK